MFAPRRRYVVSRKTWHVLPITVTRDAVVTPRRRLSHGTLRRCRRRVSGMGTNTSGGLEKLAWSRRPLPSPRRPKLPGAGTARNGHSEPRGEDFGPPRTPRTRPPRSSAGPRLALTCVTIADSMREAAVAGTVGSVPARVLAAPCLCFLGLTAQTSSKTVFQGVASKNQPHLVSMYALVVAPVPLGHTATRTLPMQTIVTLIIKSFAGKTALEVLPAVGHPSSKPQLG
mmetsp:Transcript_58296/g.155229  ORF Transcript_58296/g.155229 Transcript_58296/m.155229 type:complete len:228 (+) Transcript_58296:186-869(+)